MRCYPHTLFTYDPHLLLVIGLITPVLIFGRQVEPSQAQNSKLLGVWKADLEKSKMAGPPVKEYVLLIEQQQVVIDRKTGEKGAEVREIINASLRR